MGKINPIELRKTKCGICNFESGFGSSKDFAIEQMTYFDFIVNRECACLRNIYEKEELNECDAIKNIENYQFYFKKFIQISLLLNDFYSRVSDSEDISHDCVSLFFQEENFNSFEELYSEIDKTQIKKYSLLKKNETKIIQNDKLQLYGDNELSFG